MDYLERQLGDRAKIIRANKEFTNQVADISRIQSRISNLKLMSSEEGSGIESQQELMKAERMLLDATNNQRHDWQMVRTSLIIGTNQSRG